MPMLEDNIVNDEKLTKYADELVLNIDQLCRPEPRICGFQYESTLASNMGPRWPSNMGSWLRLTWGKHGAKWGLRIFFW